GRRSSMPLVLMPSIRPRLVAQAALCERQEARLRALRAQRPDDDEELNALATAHATPPRW
ncbi:MAG TPA: hypothetical protein VKB76_18635, partial [Ktedonobacterales bacterium]|nr:hypothetical protein [Ktedonobacterales bacterium]